MGNTSSSRTIPVIILFYSAVCIFYLKNTSELDELKISTRENELLVEIDKFEEMNKDDSIKQNSILKNLMNIEKSVPDLLFEDLHISPPKTSKHSKILNLNVPETSIMFLKTIKTASSTVQNMLYRLAETRGLSVALPASGKNNLQYPHSYRHSGLEMGYKMLAKTSAKPRNRTVKFDIFCNHARHSSDLPKALASNSTFYFTVLRHPSTLIKSIFDYIKVNTGAFQDSKYLLTYLRNPGKYYNTTREAKMYRMVLQK